METAILIGLGFMWITSCSLYSLGLIMKARCCLMETEWVVCAVYHRLSSASPSAPNSPDSLSQPLLFVSHGSDLIAHVRGRMKRERPGCSEPQNVHILPHMNDFDILEQNGVATYFMSRYFCYIIERSNFKMRNKCRLVSGLLRSQASVYQQNPQCAV